MSGQEFTGMLPLTDAETAETQRVAAEIGMDPDVMIREYGYLKYEGQALRDAVREGQHAQQASDVETLSGHRHGLGGASASYYHAAGPPELEAGG